MQMICKYCKLPIKRFENDPVFKKDTYKRKI